MADTQQYQSETEIAEKQAAIDGHKQGALNKVRLAELLLSEHDRKVREYYAWAAKPV